VQWDQVAGSGLVCALIGLFHWIFRKPFSQLSRDYDQARRSGVRVLWWDFLFYLSFGLVMIFAVPIGGILLIFAFLIIPSSISALLARSWGVRMAISWSIGLVASMVGLVLSWTMDLQAGPTVVCILGAVLILVGVGRRLRGGIRVFSSALLNFWVF